MIVVNRFRVPEADAAAFRADLERAREDARRADRLRRAAGSAATSTTPSCGCSITEWEGPGAYRRALSSYDVKLAAVPTLSRAIDEPSAYEPVVPGEALNVRWARSLG